MDQNGSEGIDGFLYLQIYLLLKPDYIVKATHSGLTMPHSIK